MVAATEAMLTHRTALGRQRTAGSHGPERVLDAEGSTNAR